MVKSATNSVATLLMSTYATNDQDKGEKNEAKNANQVVEEREDIDNDNDDDNDDDDGVYMNKETRSSLCCSSFALLSLLSLSSASRSNGLCEGTKNKGLLQALPSQVQEKKRG